MSTKNSNFCKTLLLSHIFSFIVEKEKVKKKKTIVGCKKLEFLLVINKHEFQLRKLGWLNAKTQHRESVKKCFQSLYCCVKSAWDFSKTDQGINSLFSLKFYLILANTLGVLI